MSTDAAIRPLLFAGMLAVLPALQSCSTCYDTTALIVRPSSPARGFELQETAPYVTRLLVPDVLDVRMGLCEPWSDGKKFVCVHLRVVPGATARFAGDTFTLTRTGGAGRRVGFPPQQFQALCESRDNRPVECPAVLRNLPEAAKYLLNMGGYKDWKFERWGYTVPPTLTFVGMNGDPDPPALKLLSRYSRWRAYTLQLVPDSEFDTAETLLQLPDIELAGKVYSLPPMSVRVGPTRVCPVYA
jgi:hypothetical protein